MLFNTIDYLIFFSLVFVVYHICPKKIRYIWLLGASYYFYMNWNPWYVFLLLGCTVITYFAARIIDSDGIGAGNRKKAVRMAALLVCISILLAVLGYFKYYDLFLGYVNRLIGHFSTVQLTRRFEVLLPVGISFYVLQSLGYVFDVYRGDIHAEKNFLKYALFVSFFPQLVAGPIERAENLLSQLSAPEKLTFDLFRKGLLLIFYGLFCKIVVADRIAVIVKTVYGDPASYPGFYILYAAVLFSFQIYCDFYGYSTIARGSALLLGVRLTDNFNAPYYAQSVKEFWQRWHISLSSWFRDYLYIPLGGNRRGFARKNRNLLLVFGVSGLWHGASLSFVIWGLLNGVYQVASSVYHRASVKLRALTHFNESCAEEKGKRFSSRLLSRVITFGLITITWIFFAAGSFKKSIQIVKALISVNNWYVIFDQSLYELGVSRQYTVVMLAGILILMAVDYVKYKGKDIASLILSQGWWLRAFVYVALIFAALVFGCYGEMYDTQQFIYFQF